MNFNEYQEQAATTAIYPGRNSYPTGLMYAALGLCGEAGEVAEQVKKSWRNDMEVLDDRERKMFNELGDVLWYVAAVAEELGFSLEEVAEANIVKLTNRKSAGMLKEHGD